MPWNITKTASIDEKELLRFPTGLHAIKSVVLDGTATWLDKDGNNLSTVLAAGGRFQIPLGYPLVKGTRGGAVKYQPYAGTGTVAGILGRTIDMIAGVTENDEPVNMFFHECVFATEAIVGFTQYASALINDLKTCKFE